MPFQAGRLQGLASQIAQAESESYDWIGDLLGSLGGLVQAGRGAIPAQKPSAGDIKPAKAQPEKGGIFTELIRGIESAPHQFSKNQEFFNQLKKAGG